MSEHLSEQQIRDYRQRTLSPAERLTISDHLAACSECRRRLRPEVAPAARSLEADLRSALQAEPEHLTFDEMATYVDGVASEADREIVEGHIEICPQCATELRELRGFRAMLSTYPQQTLSPAKPPTLREKLRALLRLPAGQFVVRTAIPVAAAALIVLAIQAVRAPVGRSNTFIPRSVDDMARSQEIARLKRSVQEAQEQYAVALKQSDRYRQEEQSEKALRAKQAAEQEHLAKQLAARAAALPQTVAQNLVQDRQGNLHFQVPVRKQDRSVVVAALAKGRLTMPSAVDAVLPDHAILMGGGNSKRYVTLRGPISTLILAQRPTLRWQPVARATRYRVTVVYGQREPVASAELTQNGVNWQAAVSAPGRGTPHTYPVESGTEWTLPPEVAPLKPGVTYKWTVEAYNNANTQPVAVPREPAKFGVLDARQRAEVARAQSQYAASHLLLGIFYTSRGLLEAAHNEFAAQLRLNPQDKEALRLMKALESKLAAGTGQ